MTRPRTARRASRDSHNADLALYFRETRAVDVALCYVAVLALIYEVMLQALEPSARSAYATRVHDLLWYLGDGARFCHLFLLLIAIEATRRALRRGAPLVRLFPAFLAESALLALLLGPLALFVVSLGESFVPAPPPPPAAVVPALLASLGAGLYEEMLFRWIGVGGVYVALRRLARLPEYAAATIAILFAALAFALFHHIGPNGEPFHWSALGFRFVAGIILGVVFVGRGLGIAVYLHAFYDVFFDVRGIVFSS